MYVQQIYSNQIAPVSYDAYGQYNQYDGNQINQGVMYDQGGMVYNQGPTVVIGMPTVDAFGGSSNDPTSSASNSDIQFLV